MVFITVKKFGVFFSILFSGRLLKQVACLCWIYYLSTTECMMGKTGSEDFCCNPSPIGMHCTTLPATSVSTLVFIGNVCCISQKLQLIETAVQKIH